MVRLWLFLFSSFLLCLYKTVYHAPQGMVSADSSRMVSGSSWFSSQVRTMTSAATVVHFVAILGAVACSCTGTAVTSSSTSMASCQQWEGSRRSASCSSSPSRAFGERSAVIGRDRIHSGTRSQCSVEGSSSCSTRSFFGCAIDRMSRFYPAFSAPTDGGGTWNRRHWMELSRVCPGCAKRWREIQIFHPMWGAQR